MAEKIGPNVVTIIASGPIRVITETIMDGGRERKVNGDVALEANVEHHCVVNAEQSIRVVSN